MRKGLLLFPGRHLLHTRYQEEFLNRVVGRSTEEIRPLLVGDGQLPQFRVEQVVFAITSANQSNTRYNPVPLHARAVQVDRFSQYFRGVGSTVVPIPHMNFLPSLDAKTFCSRVVKQVEQETEGLVLVHPSDSLVLCCTPGLKEAWRSLGFWVLEAESKDGALSPMEVLSQIMTSKSREEEEKALSLVHPSTRAFWERDAMGMITLKHMRRIWKDPLLNDKASLTDTRDYDTYALGMNNTEILKIKYDDVKRHLDPSGTIVDEGCADGALLQWIAKDFPDADLIGVELTAEFIRRAHERQRAGHFGSSFVHFHQRNLLDREIFQPDSIRTTLCNSTAHELKSYGSESLLKAYLGFKFKQTAPSGRLVVRDVVGPENLNRKVILSLLDAASLKTFERFLATFSAPEPVERMSETSWKMTHRFAAEFLMHKDYDDNWDSEMKETFAHWSLSDWKSALEEQGFNILHARTYTSEWIKQNRWDGRVLVTDAATGEEVQTPTNIVIVAGKP